MKKLTEFHTRIVSILERIQSTQLQNIEELASIIAKKTVEGGLLFGFGTGHSHVIAEELYIRAGGLFTAKGILEPEFMLHGTKWKSTALERIEGISKSILELNGVRSKDVIIIISNSGRNAVPIEMAIEAKKMGLVVICITNMAHSQSISSRHSSGKRLFEVSDYILDNCGVPGDCTLGFSDAQYRSGATSTITGSYIIQLLVAQIIVKIKELGETPPVMLSSNLDGNDAYNENLLRSYLTKFPELETLLK
jgi:uncharacterized phosphosugar-binding protein